jgi:hypothetical protein
MSTALALVDDARAEITETGLSLPAGLSSDDWAEIGEKLGEAHKASAWWIGDWINYGERQWGEIYEQAQRITGLSYNHLSDCSRIARRFPKFTDRSVNLTWTHYLRAASLDNAEEWLVRAEEEEWSVRELTAQTSSHRVSKPPMYYGKGDKFWEAVKPAKNYVNGWRPEKFASLNPAEAARRLKAIRELKVTLTDVEAELERRSLRAGITRLEGA